MKSVGQLITLLRVRLPHSYSVLLITLALPLILVSVFEAEHVLGQGAVHAGDRAALIALYNATDGPNWENNDNWGSGQPLSAWHGVTTDGNGRVTKLGLHDNLLRGRIPPELGNLSNLEVLDFNFNQLSGEIPSGLGNLASLSKLWLEGNQLSGEIPPELGGLSNLTHLMLHWNQLTGEIPPELGNLASLTHLLLDRNQLTGEIPPELGNLRQLEQMWLGTNQLTGGIPPQLGNLQNLMQLGLSYNQLAGEMPPELGNLRNLKYLGLSNTGLTGVISPRIGNLQNLANLFLSYNQLTGEIPPELGNLKNLTHLQLSSNGLTGRIPLELSSLQNLMHLNLSSNGLTGEIPPELGNLQNLMFLDLSLNRLTGEIPLELSTLQDLMYLDFSYSQLTGEIPPELGNLPNLASISLSANRLTGRIPPELGSLENLRSLRLFANRLTGEIPLELGRLFGLELLELQQNDFAGCIPWLLLRNPLLQLHHDDLPSCPGPQVKEGGTTSIPTPFLLSDIDSDESTRTVTGVGDPVNGTVHLEGTTIIYQHDGSETTFGGFSYIITDGDTQGTKSVMLVVTPVNDSPVATADRVAVDEGEALMLDASELLVNDSDPDGDMLRIIQTSDPVNGTVHLDGSSIIYEHDGSETTSGGFSYNISDGSVQDTASVIVDVAPVNDPPMAAPDAGFLEEGGTVLLDASELLANDSDPDSETLSVVHVSNPVNGTVHLDGEFITYEHDGSETTAGEFTYTVSDGNAQSTVSVMLAVTPVNDPPVATSDRIVLDQGGTISLDTSELLANDSDPDSESLSLVQVGNPVNGTVQLEGALITYQHDNSETTTGGFSYTITDSSAKDTASVIVDVTLVNDPPTATADKVSLDEGGTLLLDASELLANDSDPDSKTLLVARVGGAANGSVRLDGTTITYQHDGSETTLGGFTYTVTDGNSQDTASVMLALTPVNDPPTAGADRDSLDEGGTLLLDTSELLANDFDPDSASLSIVQVSNPVNGTVQLDGAIITYQHDDSETTSGGFTYTITDGSAQDTASVILDVNPVDDPFPWMAIGISVGAILLLLGVVGTLLLVKAKRSRGA